MKPTPAFLLITALSAAVVSAADITGKVTLSGTPPPEQVNPAISSDPTCSKMHSEPVTTHHFIVSPNHELANVVVMLKGVPAKAVDAKTAPAVLDQKGCLYVPQILAVQTGQKLMVKNSDPTLHNVHTTPVGTSNKEENQAQMSGAPELSFSFSAPENFLKFKCDVHNWMFAWVTVVDHPYFAVTGADGSFKISNVPPGKYTITALHRKAAPTGMDKPVEVKEDGAKVDFALEVK